MCIRDRYNLEFTSERKRQSVIVRDSEGNIILYCKGADSAILDLINSKATRSQSLDGYTSAIKQFSSLGLRTLVLSKRIISEEEFESWAVQYKKTCSQIEDRDEAVQRCQSLIEKNLTLIGVTGIEDTLQDQVPESVEAFLKAGIKFWVLTGDKVETAINVAFACKIIRESYKQYTLNVEHNATLGSEQKHNYLAEELKKIKKDIQQQQLQCPANKKHFRCSLIMTADAFMSLHQQNSTLSVQNKLNLIFITDQCQSVLCCRFTPKQKEQIVTLLRQLKAGQTVLAIGDGANDVNMITASHVGIGIKGLEGHQAARASDYSISEFKQLRRLLFVHGREAYRRNSLLINYNFYKNSLLIMPQFWYGWYNFFSGITIYDIYPQQFFNVFYASLPIIVYAIFDQEMNHQKLFENKANYYQRGLTNYHFNWKVFLWWLLNSCGAGAIMCVFSFSILEENFVNSHGQTFTMWVSGLMIFIQVVVVCNLKLLVCSYDYSLLFIISIISMIIMLYLTLITVNYMKTSVLEYMVTRYKYQYV
eukprot:TRINITY_DN14842_c0_g1_i3.p1 TRINITY_DN14842_c0_g1~~TRINITY_DN14842_c0_g1_i3.p1  ORF type:complete len:534 (+),score=51.47 TRINITY_DN14842_c0_g1_i3:156-1757(+)